MLEALGNLAIFSFKTVVIVIAIAMVLGLFASLRRGRNDQSGKVLVVDVGKKLSEQQLHLLAQCGDKSSIKQHKNTQKQIHKQRKTQKAKNKQHNSRHFVDKQSATQLADASKNTVISSKNTHKVQSVVASRSQDGTSSVQQNQVPSISQKSSDKENDNQPTHSPESDAMTYVMRFHGDIRASENAQLAKKVTALLQLCRPHKDEVVVQLESAGGMVHSYGLAASQLKRLVDANIHLVVCVDKVAASGGYMMACVANHIVAAPFALVGSIGVVAQLPNIHKLLTKWQIEIELHTAGKYKRTLTTLGKNTPEARRKFQKDLERTHGLFQSMVAKHRPQLSMKKIATGEVWYGQEALDFDLIDEIALSDEYIFRRYKEQRQVFMIDYKERKKLSARVGNAAAVCVDFVIARVLQYDYEQKITSGNSR